MAKSKKGPDYSAYVKQYRARETMLLKKGFSMAYPMLNAEGFEQLYIMQREEFKEQVAAGQRLKVGNITRALVSRQAYVYSEKQARAIQKTLRAAYNDPDTAELMRDYGITETDVTSIDVTQFRYKSRASEPAWDIISRRYHELRGFGLKGREAGEIIGEEFFGS